MKIQELELTKQLKRAAGWPLNLDTILLDHGWKVLGWGAEGIVAEHPSKPYVLKIYRANSRYSDFVRFSQAHQSNPHVPRFGRYMRDLPGNWKYVRMEILQEFADQDQLVKKFLPELAVLEWYGPGGGLSRRLGNQVESICRNLYDINLIPGMISLEDLQARVGHPDDSWLELMPAFKTFTHQLPGNLHVDLHAGNFMKRGATLVIIDPYV